MNILPGNMRFGAGESVKRREDQRLLTGRGQFIDDKPADGALWLMVQRSPHAHAKILSIDTEAARAMPGVVAILHRRRSGRRQCRHHSDAADLQASRRLADGAAAAPAACA